MSFCFSTDLLSQFSNVKDKCPCRCKSVQVCDVKDKCRCDCKTVHVCDATAKRCQCCTQSHPANLPLRVKLENVLRDDNPSNLLIVGGANGVVPPSPVIAVGIKVLIVMVNTQISIYRKDTLERLFHGNFHDFFQTASSSIEPSDPWVFYDEFANRFWLSLGSGSNTNNTIFFAVSKNANPTNGDDWLKYTYVTNFPIVTAPISAADKCAFYVAFRGVTPGVSLAHTVIAFHKKRLMNPNNAAPGAVTSVTPDFIQSFGDTSPGTTNNNVQRIFPVQPRRRLSWSSACDLDSNESCSIQQVVFAQSIVDNPTALTLPGSIVTGNIIRLFIINNIFRHSKVITVDIKVARYSSNLVGVPQPAPSSNALSVTILPLTFASDLALRSGTLDKNTLWLAQSVQSGRNDDAGNRLYVARWYEICVENIFHGKSKLIQQGNVDPGTNINTFVPSIQVDKDGNMGIQFSISGIDQFPAIAFTGRLKNDPKGTVRLPIQVALSPNLYIQGRLSTNPWGAYTGLAMDPCDHKMFWLFNEYPVASPLSVAPFVGVPSPLNLPPFPFNANWSTFLGAFRIDKACPLIPNAPQKHHLVCK